MRSGRWLFALSLLAVLGVWIAAQARVLRLSPAANLVMAAVTVAVAVSGVAFMVSQARAARRLRERGLAATATIEKISERFVYVPYGYSGWVTSVTVRFTDTRGESVRVDYTDYARAGGKQAGQPLPIVYDPDRPTSISPLGADAKPEDPRFGTVFLMGAGVIGILVVAGYFVLHALG
jgi:hypothetical protein